MKNKRDRIYVLCQVGCNPECSVCGRRKAPLGRDVAPAMAGDMCGYECAGYQREPPPCDLWPGEKRGAVVKPNDSTRSDRLAAAAPEMHALLHECLNMPGMAEGTAQKIKDLFDRIDGEK